MPVTARMVRATRSGSSIMGSCPTPGRIMNDAWGTRSRAILSHAETGSTASFSDHAMMTGHGRGFSGAICSSDPTRSSTPALQPTP